MNTINISTIRLKNQQKYDFIPYHDWGDPVKGKRPNKYKLKQRYEDDNPLWQVAKDSDRVGVRLNNLVLVDYDANKPESVGEIPTTEEMATALGYANYKALADKALIQWNQEGTSLHFLFTAPPDFNLTDFKQSNQGTKEYFWKHIDIKTGNQLVYLKQGKTSNLRDPATYPLAPQLVMEQLKNTSTFTQSNDYDYNHKPSEHQIKLANEWLHEAVIEMENTPDGNRNGTLNTLGCTVSGLIASGALDNQTAYEQLYHAAIKAGSEVSETVNTLASAWEEGFKTPRRDAPYSATASKSISEVFKGHEVTNTKVVMSFDNFSFVGDLDNMRKQLKDSKYVMGKLAILGQATVFYAEQNSGKTLLTLHLLIESIKAGNINAEQVYYINSDDTYRGLCTKGELAKKHNFKMLASGHGEPTQFKNEMLIPILKEMVEKDTAQGVIIILDTLKKFTDLMDKKSSSTFAEAIRAFSSKGGTVIALAHTNKHRNAEGKLDYQGTNDIISDFDCSYIMDLVSGNDNNQRVVEFENKKARGDVINKVSYTYTKHDNSSYLDIFNSVKMVSDDEAEKQKHINRANQLVEDNSEAIEGVQEAIRAGYKTRKEIQQHCKDELGLSIRQTEKVFSYHCGELWNNGHRISYVKTGEGNQRIYSVKLQ